ncbi:MAG: diaminopimelate decarboxylase [Cyanobacteria bacterium WB6_1B_304]|jgi:diaminopimelate decarboxylase|nr:diaminopimelate decarboxylase [Cyanobacteria bacterium WB6_1B_304]
MTAIQTTSSHQSGHHFLPKETEDGHTISPNQWLLPLTAKVNAQDHLQIGGCDVVELVGQFGSPLYILDETTLRTTCRHYRHGFLQHYSGQSQVLYASKAWNMLAVCAIIASEDLGIDVVSGGELYTALEAGIKGSLIYFHGNNKSVDELELAISHDCTIVVDNWNELHNLVHLSHHTPSPISIMLRLTPGIECHTHEYIRTGHLDSKFGFDPDQLEAVFNGVVKETGLSCIGLHAHIGSQIFELQPHQDLGGVIVQWYSKALAMGLPVTELNIGGGLGIRYTHQDDPPSIENWVKGVAQAITEACHQYSVPLPKLLCEPGRSIIGTAGVTAYTIGSQKVIPQLRTYITVDGGMSDNPRPITYQSVYGALLANHMSAPMTQTVAVAGKHCESGDILIAQALLPVTQSGDILVIPATGAYNYSMSSNYNRVTRPAAVLVGNGDANLILQRETYQDLIRGDRLPERLRIT